MWSDSQQIESAVDPPLNAISTSRQRRNEQELALQRRRRGGYPRRLHQAEGADASPVASNSFTPCGNEAEVRLIASACLRVARLATGVFIRSHPFPKSSQEF